MTKAELINLVQKEHKEFTKKSIACILDTAFKVIQNSVHSESRFSYPGFGTFVIRNRKSRTGRDPRSGDEIQIKASKTVGFKPAKSFKEQIQF